MYTVYVDDNLVYSPSTSALGYSIGSPSLTMELNKAGSFEFTISSKNPMYNSLQKLKSTVVVKQDGKEIWRGRILEIDRDFYNNRTVFCEGELNFLNDILIEPAISTGSVVISEFRRTLRDYGEHCDPSRKILMGNITAVDPQSHVSGYETTEYTSALSSLSSATIDLFGGYFKLRRENNESYLDYRSILEDVSDQTIRFGENLLDLNEYIDSSEVYTYLYAQGALIETQYGYSARVGLESASGNDGKPYVYSESGEKLFGRIERCVVYDDIEDANSLLEAAKKDLDTAIEENTTIEIKALDLSLLGVDANKLEVGMQVSVISSPHQINDYFLCSKIKLKLEDASRSTYTFGMTPTTLTGMQNDTASVANSAYSIASGQTGGSIYYVTKTEFNSYRESIQNELDSLENSLDGVYIYKGTVASYDLLPTHGDKNGDVYNVSDTGANYAWTGSGWDKLSENTDLFASREEYEDLLSRVEQLEKN